MRLGDRTGVGALHVEVSQDLGGMATEACLPYRAERRQELPRHHPRACESRAEYPGVVVAPPSAGLDLLRKLPGQRLAQQAGRIPLMLERAHFHSPVVPPQVGPFDAAETRRVPHLEELYHG